MGRALVSPRGAQSFEYVPALGARAARPSEVDAGGGAVVSVLGTDLHTAGACRFNPAPVEHTAVHVISSALVRCEVPRREVGSGALTLVAETPAEAAEAAAAAAGGGVEPTALAAISNDNESPGLALLARRPATVSSVTASRAMASTSITIWGGDFVASAVAPGGAAPGARTALACDAR